MILTIQEAVLDDMPDVYFTGDDARRDGWIFLDHGPYRRRHQRFRASNRNDGSRKLLVSHPTVAEAAVVGRPDDLKGQAFVAFVSLAEGY